VELFVPFGREATRTETRWSASGAKVVARVECDKVVGENIEDTGCDFLSASLKRRSTLNVLARSAFSGL
jgi:hypothetical protein